MWLWNIFVKFVILFLPKSCRTTIKYKMLGIFNKLYVLRKAKSVGENFSCTDDKTVINKNTIIGENVFIHGLSIDGTGKVNIGNFVHFGKEVLILTSNHNYEGEKIPYDSTFIYKEVCIGDFVWIGTRVTILPGTKIGEGAIIQAGSVVHGEIPPLCNSRRKSGKCI